MKKNVLFLAIIYFVTSSCSKKNEIIEKYDNGYTSHKYYAVDSIKEGKYEEFYKNGNIKAIYIYEKDIKQDSSIHYYKEPKETIKTIKYWKDNNAYYQKDFFDNGNLMSEGSLLKENFRIGKWDLYSIENYKNEIIEYMNIKGESYKNQSWKLNREGDTLEGGNYYELIRKKTAILEEPYCVHFFLKQPLFLNSESFVYIPEESYECNQDFSNEEKINWAKVENVARWHKDLLDRNHDIIYSFWTKKVNRDTLRGYILEKEILRNSEIDSITRKIYFNIPYFIRRN